jgi:DNA-binding transcriptional MocR family regulator
MQLSAGAKRLLQTLKSLARLSGRAFPFQRTLAAKLSRTVRTIQRWLAELVRAGLVSVQKRQHSSAEYHLENVVSGVVSGAQKCRVCASYPLMSENLEWRGGPTQKTEPKPPQSEYRQGITDWGRVPKLMNQGLSYDEAVLRCAI